MQRFVYIHVFQKTFGYKPCRMALCPVETRMNSKTRALAPVPPRLTPLFIFEKLLARLLASCQNPTHKTNYPHQPIKASIKKRRWLPLPPDRFCKEDKHLVKARRQTIIILIIKSLLLRSSTTTEVETTISIPTLITTPQWQ